MLRKTVIFGWEAARSTTTGLLFFYPLGLLSSILVCGALVLFAPTPTKGLYGGASLAGESIPVFVIFTGVVFVASWIVTIYEARKVRLWPRRASFLFGLLYGAAAVTVAAIALFMCIIPGILIVFMVLEVLFEYWLVSGAILLLVIFLIAKEEKRRS